MPAVLITGANRGIGFELAQQYAANGWEVIATCRNPYACKDLGELKVRVEQLDVTNFGAIDTLAKKLEGTAIDVLINNAGIFGGDDMPDQTFSVQDLERWPQVLLTNTIAPFAMARAFVEHVAGSEQKKIVTITSQLGSMALGNGGCYAYGSSKAAVNRVMVSLSVDLKDRGITCAVLHPGWVKTDMGTDQAELEVTESVTGLRRVIDDLTLARSGRFFNYDGSERAW